MRSVWRLLGFGCWLIVASCATRVTRHEAVDTAYRYTRVAWMPEERHVRHGLDSVGLPVHTPDLASAWPGDRRGWWKPGVPAEGMPYQWGGFDTPESFVRKIRAGYKAGDIGGPEKRRLGDAGVSAESCGIDCSGLVSRCWKLPRPYSTRELPSICVPLAHWWELKPGDIVLNDRHVVLFSGWREDGTAIHGYEAGPMPVWKVSACGLPLEMLEREGYRPWRYPRMVD